MSNSLARSSLTSHLLGAVFLLVTASAPTTQPDTSSADARLRALYTEEWSWRQQELARGDQPGEAGARDRRASRSSGATIRLSRT